MYSVVVVNYEVPRPLISGCIGDMHSSFWCPRRDEKEKFGMGL